LQCRCFGASALSLMCHMHEQPCMIAADRLTVYCSRNWLRQRQPLLFIFLTEISKWLPMCPDTEVVVKNKEYLVSRLNDVTKGHKENMTLQQDCQRIWNEQMRKKGSMEAGSVIARSKAIWLTCKGNRSSFQSQNIYLSSETVEI